MKSKRLKSTAAALSRLAGLALLTLILSGCGAPQAAQSFITMHTFCPLTYGYYNPIWSPDGALIYYSLTVSTQRVLGDIRVMQADGTGDRLLAHSGDLDALSTDGTQLMFDRPNATTQFTFDYFILDLRMMQTRQVIGGVYDPVWSPDGRWIAYTRSGVFSGPLYKTDLVSGQTIQLSDTQPGSQVGYSYPRWSPDGTRIAFESNRDGLPSAYVMNADGSGVTRLPQGSDPTCSPSGTGGEAPIAWSPDGSALALIHSCQTNVWLRIVSPGGVEIADWRHLNQEATFPEWSPDGKRLLFESGDANISTLNVANVDGSGLRVLSPTYWRPTHWSPDGTRIAYVGRDAAGFDEIYVVSSDGSNVTQLTRNPSSGQICLH